MLRRRQTLSVIPWGICYEHRQLPLRATSAVDCALVARAGRPAGCATFDRLIAQGAVSDLQVTMPAAPMQSKLANPRADIDALAERIGGRQTGCLGRCSRSDERENQSRLRPRRRSEL